MIVSIDTEKAFEKNPTPSQKFSANWEQRGSFST